MIAELSQHHTPIVIVDRTSFGILTFSTRSYASSIVFFAARVSGSPLCHSGLFFFPSRHGFLALIWQFALCGRVCDNIKQPPPCTPLSDPPVLALVSTLQLNPLVIVASTRGLPLS